MFAFLLETCNVSVPKRMVHGCTWHYDPECPNRFFHDHLYPWYVLRTLYTDFGSKLRLRSFTYSNPWDVIRHACRAGTGLSSALSVLQEMLTRKARREPVPQLVWFVWSCRSEKQLDWCWSALQEIVFNAWKAGALEIDENWSPYTSNMFDWLGITGTCALVSVDRKLTPLQLPWCLVHAYKD